MSSLNPLEGYPRTRKIIYNVYWAVGVVLGAIPVAFAVTTQAVPMWSVVAMAIFGYLGIALGFTADQNVKTKENQDV